VLGTLADYKALIGQDPATEGVSDATVAQDGAQAVRTLPATVPYQDPVSGATTTGVSVSVSITVRDCP